MDKAKTQEQVDRKLFVKLEAQRKELSTKSQRALACCIESDYWFEQAKQAECKNGDEVLAFLETKRHEIADHVISGVCEAMDFSEESKWAHRLSEAQIRDAKRS